MAQCVDRYSSWREEKGLTGREQKELLLARVFLEGNETQRKNRTDGGRKLFYKFTKKGHGDELGEGGDTATK